MQKNMYVKISGEDKILLSKIENAIMAQDMWAQNVCMPMELALKNSQIGYNLFQALWSGIIGSFSIDPSENKKTLCIEFFKRFQEHIAEPKLLEKITKIEIKVERTKNDSIDQMNSQMQEYYDRDYRWHTSAKEAYLENEEKLENRDKVISDIQKFIGNQKEVIDVSEKILFEKIGVETLKKAIDPQSDLEKELAVTFLDKLCHFINKFIREISGEIVGYPFSSKEAKEALLDLLSTGKALNENTRFNEVCESYTAKVKQEKDQSQINLDGRFKYQ